MSIVIIHRNNKYFEYSDTWKEVLSDRELPLSSFRKHWLFSKRGTKEELLKGIELAQKYGTSKKISEKDLNNQMYWNSSSHYFVRENFSISLNFSERYPNPKKVLLRKKTLQQSIFNNHEGQTYKKPSDEWGSSFINKDLNPGPILLDLLEKSLLHPNIRISIFKRDQHWSISLRHKNETRSYRYIYNSQWFEKFAERQYYDNDRQVGYLCQRLQDFRKSFEGCRLGSLTKCKLQTILGDILVDLDRSEESV